MPIFSLSSDVPDGAGKSAVVNACVAVATKVRGSVIAECSSIATTSIATTSIGIVSMVTVLGVSTGSEGSNDVIVEGVVTSQYITVSVISFKLMTV